MAWSAIPTYSNNQLIGFADMNLLKANLEYLKTRPYAVDVGGSNTTTSTSFAQIGALTQTVTAQGGNWKFWLVGEFKHSGANIVSGFDFRVDTVSVMGAVEWVFTTPAIGVATWFSGFFITTTPPATGSRVFDVYWKTASGTLTMNQSRCLYMEVF